MKKVILYIATSTSIFGVSGHLFADSPYFSLKDGDGFKRFSISAGWLHASPQGDPNPVTANTVVSPTENYAVGDIGVDTVTGAIANTDAGNTAKSKLNSVVSLGKVVGLVKNNTLTANMSGTANITSLQSWNNPNTGLKADNVDTLGIMTNYFFTDHLSLEIKAGVPPKVNIKGQGQINAPVVGTATPKGDVTGILSVIANPLIDGIGAIPLDTKIPITNLAQNKKAASATAWLPAAELHYQFGKTGVNKFRPYVGLGVMYAHFTHLKLDSGVENDLVAAGHMIQNVLDGKAGAALEGKTSSANPTVKVKADDAWAPMATLGATYDINPNWFAVGSVTYAPMSGDANITISDSNTGKQLITAKTKIDIDPLITYVGVGYRF